VKRRLEQYGNELAVTGGLCLVFGFPRGLGLVLAGYGAAGLAGWLR
jgi:hypothetical protein